MVENELKLILGVMVSASFQFIMILECMCRFLSEMIFSVVTSIIKSSILWQVYRRKQQVGHYYVHLHRSLCIIAVLFAIAMGNLFHINVKLGISMQKEGSKVLYEFFFFFFNFFGRGMLRYFHLIVSQTC